MRLPYLLGIVAVAGCMGQPHDGQVVAGRDAPVAFAGYHTHPGARVRIDALNPATGRFDSIAGATAGASPAANVFGVPWHAWAVSAVVQDPYWVRGRAGASATVRAATGAFPHTSMREGYPDCFARSGDRSLFRFLDDCAAGGTPQAVICTRGFLPSGPRRECPRRILDLVAPEYAGTRRYEAPPRTVTNDATAAARPFRLAWRGDAVSFIDVFDEPVGGFNVAGRPDQVGLSSGNFVRVFYPHPGVAMETAFFDPDAIAAGRTVVPWGGARSVRVYDRGACSVLVTWREILRALGDEVEPLLHERFGLRPLGRASVTPVLRPDGMGDAIGYGQTFGTGRVGPNFVTVRLLLGLRATADARLVSSVDHVDVDVGSLPGTGEARERLVASLRTGVPPVVDALVLRLAGGGIVPLRRVFVRPEGVEFVVAEEPGGAAFEVFRALRLCERPDPAGTAPLTGYFDSVFDPPLPDDPPVFGNTP